jgi:hypothetical protein
MFFVRVRPGPQENAGIAGKKIQDATKLSNKVSAKFTSYADLIVKPRIRQHLLW